VVTIYQAGRNALPFLSLLEGFQDYISDLLNGRVLAQETVALW